MVKKCVIRGYTPLLICGTGTTGTTYKNYGSHATDYKKFDPFGGGISTLNFNLEFLYDEYTKHRNSWSRTNKDLELIRYKGCSFKLYRHPTVDFFIKYNRKEPFTDSQLTGPKLHPSNIMMERRKILLKSFKTHPKGKATKTFRVRPPTLYTDKWYFQRDFCKLPLVNIGASIGNLRFPFCRPQTDNPCIYFQVFSKAFSNMLSISPDKLQSNYTTLTNYLKNHWHDNLRKGTLSNFIDKDRIGTVFNTFKTEEHIKQPPIVQQKNESDQTSDYNKYYTGGPYSYDKVNSLWGDYIYNQKIIDAFTANASNYYSSRKGSTPPFTSSQYLNHKTGLFSSIFLSKQRLSPDFPGFYTEVVYNPYNDKGIGNKVWVDACTKQDAIWRDNLTLSFPIVDLPLWMCFLGYTDYIAKATKSAGYWKECRICIICPYTDPPMYDENNTDQGYVPFDYNFGDGKMPDGQPYIPIEYRFNWYICAFHQQNFMNDMAQVGPFAYDGSEKSAVLTAKYKFTFLFGGNPITQQTIKDPCKQPTYPFPDPSGQPATVQIENPQLLDEGYYFKAWDLRRGLFGEKALKRMSAKPIDADFLTGAKKKSKLEVPAIAAGDCTSQERRWGPWSESEKTSENETESEEEQATPQTKYKHKLILHLQQQRDIKSKLQKLMKELVKTQLHLHAPIYH